MRKLDTIELIWFCWSWRGIWRIVEYMLICATLLWMGIIVIALGYSTLGMWGIAVSIFILVRASLLRPH